MVPKTSIDYKRALKLLNTYHGSVDDFFKLWPPDKQYFFSSDRKAFLAYQVANKVAVCLGDPVGHRQSIQPLLQEFHRYCSDQNWRIIFIQTNDRYQSEYTGIGLRKLLIGSDAVINLETFMKDTIHNKYFRNIVNRFSKARFKFVISRPPHSEKLLADISSISASWLTLPHRKEWSFLTGRLDSSYLRQVTVFVLQDASGAAQTFINQLPSYKHGTATIDLMRHRADAPPNSIDYLFICLLRHLKAEGYKDFNLGMSPLDANPAQNEYAARLLNHSYRLANRFIGFQGLHQFKAKYKPAWEPRYVWYQGGIHLLPQYGLAIFRLMHRPQ